MSRLALDIDPIALIRNVFGGHTPDPIQACVLSEIGGIESIICYFRSDLKTINERDLQLLNEVVKTHFNVRSDINEQIIKKLLKIKPGMVTFVESGNSSLIQPEPIYIENHFEALRDSIADLRVNDIACSVLIEPDIENVKNAGKLEFDYVEFEVSAYANADNLDEELAELENINSLAAAANKLGMGVNVSGPITAANIGDISKIPFIEDIVIGKAILDKALAVGIENAVRDFINLT
jgi:pyridoxine 5-phosphate synthase